MNWSFVEKYYPNYYSCNKILLSDILRKKVDNEEIHEEDEKMISKWNVEKELERLEVEIYIKAIVAFIVKSNRF